MKAKCKSIKPMYVGCNGEKTIHESIINDVKYIINNYNKILD